MINYEDFQKIDLRVARIIEAERLEGSDKLVKLQVDLGEEKRQIVAGIGKNYEPEDLLNKEIIIVANLEPRTVFGVESQGMLLATKDENTLSLLQPDQDIDPGSTIS